MSKKGDIPDIQSSITSRVKIKDTSHHSSKIPKLSLRQPTQSAAGVQKWKQSQYKIDLKTCKPSKETSWYS